jgi:NADPH:quinone reductase-like Zn-dependent oxidoreductase
MKKVSIRAAGGYDRLELITAPDLVCGTSDVLIDVKFAGVNYADCCVRLGVYESAKRYVGFPITPGFEVSGVVAAVGRAVTKFKVGDHVIGFTLFNGYASQAVIKEAHVLPLPKSFSLEQGAGFPAVFMTAYYALKQVCYIYPRSSILVHSVAGGVGTALTQVARSMNIEVVGIVGSRSKIKYAESIGVSKIYDKSDPAFKWEQIRNDYPRGFDAVFDANGYTTNKISYELLRPTGKLVLYGSHSLIPKTGGRLNYFKAAWGLFKTPKYDPLKMITDNKSVVCLNVSFLFDEAERVNENVAGLQSLLANGFLKPPFTKSFPIENVAEAHKHIESGLSVGKIVLKF